MTKCTHNNPADSPLAKVSSYTDQYDPLLLFPIDRQTKRAEINIQDNLPFYGHDIWNAYEISWLNPKGKPQVAIGEIIIPCQSRFLIESKSLKLYLNSFNQTRFDSQQAVSDALAQDLQSACGGSPITVALQPVTTDITFDPLDGWLCLDDLDITVAHYTPQITLKQDSTAPSVKQKLCSHLLKSNCLVTGQPDWGSLFIEYTGAPLCHERLLEYIISFRQHNEFHEQCVERMFMALLTQCQPEHLRVFARYTRRGGLDINPYRSTRPCLELTNRRLPRQ